MEQSPKRLYLFLIYAILALATFIAYEQVWRNDFIDFDDDKYVTEHPHVQ